MCNYNLSAQRCERATVIVANPTHVALRYKQHEGAPIVTTKGDDEIALQISLPRKRASRSSKIAYWPALAERVKIGRVIPADLDVAVAELLAMVYRLKNAASAPNFGRERGRRWAVRSRPLGPRKSLGKSGFSRPCVDARDRR